MSSGTNTLQWILENVPVGIVVVDQDLNVQAFNPQAKAITGLRAGDVMGRPYAEALQTQERDIADPLEEAIETGKSFVNQRFYLGNTAADTPPRPIRHSASVLDLVLLDIMIPKKLNGYDFIRQAKADPRTAEIPILILSVRSLEADINYALRLGAEKYLVKAQGEAEPDLSELVESAVHEYLDEDEA